MAQSTLADRTLDTPAPLQLTMEGFPGPSADSGMPFNADPRRLWRSGGFSSPLDLTEISTRRRTGFSGKKRAGLKVLNQRASVLSELQEMLWAHVAAADVGAQKHLVEAIGERVGPVPSAQARRRAQLLGESTERSLAAVPTGPRVLLVLQGMDASGKGGVVKSVARAMDPLGVEVTAFGKPTPEQQKQHYLQRIIDVLPQPGHVGVFDRSHYEDVLVPTVAGTHSEEDLALRVETLQVFEQELVRRGFVIVKVLLHVSAEEQLKRLLSRLDRGKKAWKYDPSDAESRSHFAAYQTVYSALTEATDAGYAPWHIIGADRKWYSRLAVQELLIAALDDLGLRWPPASYDVEAERSRLLG